MPADKGQEQPISSYLSLTSYLLQHAHLSHRAMCYAHLNLMVFRLTPGGLASSFTDWWIVPDGEQAGD